MNGLLDSKQRTRTLDDRASGAEALKNPYREHLVVPCVSNQGLFVSNLPPRLYFMRGWIFFCLVGGSVPVLAAVTTCLTPPDQLRREQGGHSNAGPHARAQLIPDLTSKSLCYMVSAHEVFNLHFTNTILRRDLDRLNDTAPKIRSNVDIYIIRARVYDACPTNSGGGGHGCLCLEMSYIVEKYLRFGWLIQRKLDQAHTVPLNSTYLCATLAGDYTTPANRSLAPAWNCSIDVLGMAKT